MKTFEEFVESRKLLDPSTQKMSEHQWQQAYAAYRSSRERLRQSSSSDGVSSSGKRRRRSEKSRGAAGSSTSSDPSSNALRQEVRQQSAYRDVRTIVDVLAWVAIAVIIASALLKMMLGIGVLAVLSYLIEGALGVIVVFIIKMLLQVLIDIPDIALYRRAVARSQSAGE